MVRTTDKQVKSKHQGKMQIMPNLKETVPKLNSPNGISRDQGREPNVIHFGCK
jgi:hypothetical protein